MSEIQNPHDQFVRSTFSDKKIASSFLENYLPPEIAGNLDFSNLEVSQESFVDEKLQEHHTDLLYKVAARTGEDVFVYVLLEHKSSPEKQVAFQLLRYLVRIWEKHKQAKKLPQIIPLVLYHGKRKWNVSREFASLIESGKDKVYAKTTPNFEYYICDLSEYDEAELKGEIALRIVLLILKSIFSPDLKDKLVEILRLFSEINEKGVIELFGKLLRYLSASSGRISNKEVRIAMKTAYKQRWDPDKLLRDFFEELQPELIEKVKAKSISEGKREGLQQGKREGLQQGKREGLQQGLQQVALRLLSKRFGDIPQTTETVVRQLSPVELEQLSEDLLDFQQLADFDNWLLKKSN